MRTEPMGQVGADWRPNHGEVQDRGSRHFRVWGGGWGKGVVVSASGMWPLHEFTRP